MRRPLARSTETRESWTKNLSTKVTLRVLFAWRITSPVKRMSFNYMLVDMSFTDNVFLGGLMSTGHVHFVARILEVDQRASNHGDEHLGVVAFPELRMRVLIDQEHTQ